MTHKTAHIYKHEPLIDKAFNDHKAKMIKQKKDNEMKRTALCEQHSVVLRDINEYEQTIKSNGKILEGKKRVLGKP